jgi:DNA-directed RNA polymerase alpha subunit
MKIIEEERMEWMYGGISSAEWYAIKRRCREKAKGWCSDVQLLDLPLQNLPFVENPLGSRAKNVLFLNGAHTIRDVCLLSEIDLFRTITAGRKTVEEIKRVLAIYNLELYTEYNEIDERHYWGA